MNGNIYTYFVTTGFRKSGNTWFESMLYELGCIGGFSNNPTAGLPLIVSRLLSKNLLDFLQRKDIPLVAVIKKLLNPGDKIFFKFTKEERNEIQAIMREAFPSLRRIKNNFYQEPNYHFLDVSRLLDPLWGETVVAPQNPNGVTVFGCPSKHMGVDQIYHLLPMFKIVNIIRDPRDVLISYFYYDLGKLKPKLIKVFTRREWFKRGLRHNPKWKRQYFSAKQDKLIGYYDKCVQSERYMAIRYENLLSDPAGQMRSVLNFLGCQYDEQELEAIIEKYKFETVTGDATEKRNSFIRKGQAGDWVNYFDQELVKILGPAFNDLVKKLGYEDDNTWIERLPKIPLKTFDFSRFRIKSSACLVFIEYWDRSPKLQQQYPNPLNINQSDSFYNWLRRSDIDEVRKWFRDADQLHQLWKVDIVENVDRGNYSDSNL